MGAVLRAVDCDIRREVAVKYLLDQTDAARRLASSRKPRSPANSNIPTLSRSTNSASMPRKRLFFAMKMVKGRSLAQVLDELRTDPKTAEKEYSLGRLLNILVNVCNALAYAHSCGVVHRDLKPANIMIGDFGEVYVMDWGLAKVLESGRTGAADGNAWRPYPAAAPLAVPFRGAEAIRQGRPSREADADLTQEGAVLGTPVYMPPEQATGHVDAIDHGATSTRWGRSVRTADLAAAGREGRRLSGDPDARRCRARSCRRSSGTGPAGRFPRNCQPSP